MGSCVVTELRSRDNREITFSADSKVSCNKIFCISQEQEDLAAILEQSGLATIQNKVSNTRLVTIDTEDKQKVTDVQVSAKHFQDNQKLYVRQSCKEDIIVLTEDGCQIASNSSLQNLNQITYQSTRNNTLSMGNNSQTTIPFTSAGMITSQSSSSLSCINPHFKNSNSLIQSNNLNNGIVQNANICINGIPQTGRRGSILFRQKSQCPSKRRNSSSSRRTSMTTIEQSRTPMIVLNSESNLSYPQSNLDEIIQLVNSKNVSANMIKEVCDQYIERKKAEYTINDYISEEYQNCIQDLAVILFKSQLQELGKYYLDKLVQHKKIITQKNLMKNLFEYQKKL